MRTSLSILASALFTFVHFSAQATITIDSITGVSSYLYDSTGLKITAGLNGTCATPGNGTCDSCTAGVAPTVCPAPPANCCGGYTCTTCNPATVHSGTIFTLNFRSDSATTGIPKLKNTDTSTDSTSGTGSGGTFLFTTSWDNVCALVSDCGNCAAFATAGAACRNGASMVSKDLTLEVTDGTNTDSATMNIKLYFQENAISHTGTTANPGALINFTVYPGDEKVYVENPEGAGSFPSSAAGLIKSIRFYIGTGTFKNAYWVTDGSSPGSTIEAATQDVDTDGSVDQVIDGLENDVTYHFRAATVDEAGNVFNIMDDAYLATQNCDLVTEGGGTNCLFSGTPSQVLGLLTEDLNCFVATAAYGSQLDKHLSTFREFRFKVLLTSELGRKLNYAYYNYGPKMARIITDHPWLKPVSRAVLWPAYGFAQLSLLLQLNLWQTLVVFITTVTVGIVSLVTGISKAREILQSRTRSLKS